MRIAYFDCLSGVSGDMILGALVDAGLELPRLQAEIDKLGVDGLRLEAEPVSRQSISATRVNVRLLGQGIAPEQEHHLDLTPSHSHDGVPNRAPAQAQSHAHDTGHDHGLAYAQENDHGRHHHGPDHHHPADIVALLEHSALDVHVRTQALRIFARLTAAEASVHGADAKKVHLHEVGALDAVADVVGAVAGLSLLGVETVYASPLYMGTGFVDCAHGHFPVPVPGVLALCEDVPCVQTDIQAELVTPTGAAVLTTLARGFGSCPLFRLRQVGYGAGRRDLEAVPNVLRLRLGDTPAGCERDQLIMVETNIDDMNPEIFGYLTEELLADGARDCTITPVYMKKGRPGSLLSILVEETALDRIIQRVLTETTSIGVRYHYVERRKLKRESATVQTEFGSVRVKICHLDGARRGTPEYEDCARLARSCGVPILSVYAAARAAMTSGGSSC